MGNVKPKGTVVLKNADGRYEYGSLFLQLILIIFYSKAVFYTSYCIFQK